MKKIISIIFLCLFINFMFAQGKMIDNYNYLISINRQITEIIKSSISKDKLNAIIKNELNVNKSSLFVEIYQDSTGAIIKVNINKSLYCKYFTKKELRNIIKKIKKIKNLNICIDHDVLQYSTKKEYFSRDKYHRTLFVIKLSRYYK